jgi:hypothetical protein
MKRHLLPFRRMVGALHACRFSSSFLRLFSKTHFERVFGILPIPRSYTAAPQQQQQQQTHFHTRDAMFAIGGKKDQAKAAAAAATRSAFKPGYTPGSAGGSGGKTGGMGSLPGGARLSMYANAPATEVALEEFELFALDRMRVLKAIDDGLSRGYGWHFSLALLCRFKTRFK